MIRTYSELSTFNNFGERFRYLKLDGAVGQDTFGFDRYINQLFYRSQRWKEIRNQVILRDNGCDLGLDGYEIYSKILIHHMNPITQQDIRTLSDNLLNPEYLICVSHKTHNAIHYGEEKSINHETIARMPNDTCPWKQKG